jgi:hypothetical protein
MTQAATLEVYGPLAAKQVVQLRGLIGPSDASRLTGLIKTALETARLVPSLSLDSLGGTFGGSVELAQVVRTFGLSTYVEDGASAPPRAFWCSRPGRGSLQATAPASASMLERTRQVTRTGRCWHRRDAPSSNSSRGPAFHHEKNGGDAQREGGLAFRSGAALNGRYPARPLGALSLGGRASNSGGSSWPTNAAVRT